MSRELQQSQSLVEVVVLQEGGGIEGGQWVIHVHKEGIIVATVVQVMAVAGNEQRHSLQTIDIDRS